MSTNQILVVEDNPLNLKLICAFLAHLDYRTVTAGNVDEARDALSAQRPDLVLLDIQIPGGGGEAVLAHIRALPALAALPVLAVTAQAMAGDRERLLAAGFDGYLSKPIDFDAFGPYVASFLDSRPA